MPTLFHKVWNAHAARTLSSGKTKLFVGLHLIHEVTSPQAFEGLRVAGRKVHRPDAILAVADHNVPTTSDRLQGIKDKTSRIQVQTLSENWQEFGIT